MPDSGVICHDVPVDYSRVQAHNGWEDLDLMSSNVTVMGGVGLEEYGLEFSVDVQSKHNEDVANKLLNISGIGTADGKKAHLSARRPEYQHQEYPKMLYKPLPGEKGWNTVKNEQEHKAALLAGWREESYPRPQVAVHDPEVEKRDLIAKNDEMHAQLLRNQEQMEAMQRQMQDLLNAQSGEVKRGPGRPRVNPTEE